MNLKDNSNYVGNARECLGEANTLVYAYFSPELDNFNEKVSVDNILFRVLTEVDLLDEGYLEEHAEESDYNWNTNRNRAWRRKAVTLLNKWADQANENAEMYRSK